MLTTKHEEVTKQGFCKIHWRKLCTWGSLLLVLGGIHCHSSGLGGGGRLFEFELRGGEGRGGRLFEAWRSLTFSAFSMGAHSRWALIRGWALIPKKYVKVIQTNTSFSEQDRGDLWFSGSFRAEKMKPPHPQLGELDNKKLLLLFKENNPNIKSCIEMMQLLLYQINRPTILDLERVAMGTEPCSQPISRFAGIFCVFHQAPVVETLNSVIHRINHYPPDRYAGTSLALATG